MNLAHFLFAAGLCTAALSLQGRDSNPLPLVLQPEKDLSALFGYEPDYSPNVVTFDRKNRPYIRSRTRDIDETSVIQTLRDGKWIDIPLLPAIRDVYPDFVKTFRAGGTTDARVIFDREDRFYTFVTIQLEKRSGKNLMLYSSDYGETIQVVEIPRRAVPAEHVSGHNELARPPFLMISERRDVDLPGDWAAVNRLSVTQPRWDGGRVVVPEPVEVSDMLVSLGQHSGGSSFAVTRDGKTHFVWAEATVEEGATGSPTFAATFDQETGAVSDPVFLLYAPPLNNSHNVPGICMDSDGFLHVVTGSHYGESFFYTRSLEPADTGSGWTDPEPVWATGWRAASGNEAGGQTYVALVCDPEDTLHLVFRHWQRRSEEYPHLAETKGEFFGALAYQRKPKSGDWSEPRTLIVPERNIYSIYYHKLSVSPSGSLYLSASYLDRVLLGRSSSERFLRRMILTSSDGGDSWRLAGADDFAAEVEW